MGLRDELSHLIPLHVSLDERWDQEWLHYFLTEDPRPFFVNHRRLEILNSVQGKSPAHVYDTRLARADEVGDLPPLCLWIHGDDLMGKHILEMGCGPGFLGKQMGKIAASYVGIDYSRFALYIARLTSPGNCLYYHVSEIDQILTHAGTMDTMVGRFFFIHQNYQNLIWILVLAFALLKPGGVLSADFYLRNPATPQGIIYPAHHALDERYPSCAFEYTMMDIEYAAKETGFTVANVTDHASIQRRFVLFIKRPKTCGS